MTADTYSSTLGTLVMGIGNDNNAWGGNANTAVFQIFEDAIANVLTSGVTGGTLDLSGSPPPAAASQTRYAALIFTGVLGSAQTIQVPNLTKFWFVKNATSGSFALTLKTSGGSASTAIPQNSGWQLVQCDGANAITVSPFNSKTVQMPDGSVSGPAYSNINEPTSGWYRAGTQDWRLCINGVDVLQCTGTGASSPSIVNILSPGALQIAGVQVIPPGMVEDYDGIELPGGGWLWLDGTAYSRATYAALFAAITKTATGDTHSSTSITNVSADLRFKGLKNAYIEGTGIPTGTTITAITSTTITLSQAATSTGAGISLRILPFGQGDASTTFNVRDARDVTLFGRGDMNGSVKGTITLVDTTVLNVTGGAESVTITQANLPSYTLPNTLGVTVGLLNVVAGTPGGSGNAAASITSGILGGQVQLTATVTGSVTSGGSGTVVNKLPPMGVTNKIIKT